MNRLRVADPSLRARNSLGRYELVRELAFGRFYSVYLARAPGEGRSVVIKRLRDAFPDAHARARMLREARVGLGLRVPQLVRVLEIHDEPELFVVMEYVEGAPLSELLARARGKDVLRYVIPVLLDALRALSALHTWKDETGAPGYLVHQAPSARHLMVGLDGGTRLVDLSNLYGRMLGNMPSAQFTLMDSELAPEQAARVALDPRCDLYIVGSVLRHVLRQSGRTNLPAVNEICERATELRPADRYWSADEMAHALHFAASEAGLLASPEDVGKWVRTSRASLIAATATAPRVRMTLPAPSPELANLVLPAQLDAALSALTPGVSSTIIEVLPVPGREAARTRELAAPWARGEGEASRDGREAARVQEREDAPAGEHQASGLEREWARGARVVVGWPVVAVGLVLALGAGAAVHTWLDRAPRVVATPLAFPDPPPVVAPAPKVEPVVTPTVEPIAERVAPAQVRAAPARTVPEPRTREPRPSESRAIEPRTSESRASEPRPSQRRALAEARDVAEPSAPRAKAPVVEPELVLHEPEVLFYDEEDPAEAPRIGVPINPF